MLGKISQIQRDLIDLAHRPNPGVIFVSGMSASGKSTLSEALCRVPEFGAIHIQLDWWTRADSGQRNSVQTQAKDLSQTNTAAYWESPLTFYDLNKFCSDFQKLRQSGELEFAAYDRETCRHTKKMHLKLSQSAPHAVILDGMPLLHGKVADLSDYIILLSLERQELESRRDIRDQFHKTSKELQESNARHWHYTHGYFEKYAPVANVSLNKEELDIVYRACINGKTFYSQQLKL